VLEPYVVRLCTEGKNFACFTTLSASGAPHSTIVWIDADDDHVLVNTELGRLQADNAIRDPRVVVMVWDLADPSHYVEVRGKVTATVSGPPARAHIDKLSQKYDGEAYSHPIRTERVIFEITPDHQRNREP
jgi:PPOX class probable F420-dependent enzyme